MAVIPVSIEPIKESKAIEAFLKAIETSGPTPEAYRRVAQMKKGFKLVKRDLASK